MRFPELANSYCLPSKAGGSPVWIRAQAVIERTDVGKDVTDSIQRISGACRGVRPCTHAPIHPYGVMTLLRHTGEPPKDTVVIGQFYGDIAAMVRELK